jgi:hypothetical protein
VDLAGVDPTLLQSIHNAARGWQGSVNIVSGRRAKAGDKGNHGVGQALDIQLIDNTGRVLPNAQWKPGATATDGRVYEAFMKRAVESVADPAFGDKARWGGYFGDTQGDWMHLDLMGNKGKRADVRDAVAVARTPAVPLAPAAQAAPAAPAGLRVPPVAAAPTPAPPAKAPPITTPLTSNARPAGPAVLLPPDVGQDVKDRRIAHIVTGGMSDLA